MVWDRFHVMKTITEAVNEERKTLRQNTARSDKSFQFSRGKYRFLFLKKASRRSSNEKDQSEYWMKENSLFFSLELIKERMFSFLDAPNSVEAKYILEEACVFVLKSGFSYILNILNRLWRNYPTPENYFKHRVPSALSEGINNVVKVLKRKAYGYRNMLHFRLKIMQRCGYLNSKHIFQNETAREAFGIGEKPKKGSPIYLMITARDTF